MKSPLPTKTTDADGKTLYHVEPWQVIGAVATAIAGIAAAFGGGNITAPKTEKNYVDEATVKNLIRESEEFISPEQFEIDYAERRRKEKVDETLDQHTTVIQDIRSEQQTMAAKVNTIQVDMVELQNIGREVSAKLDNLAPPADNP